MAPAVALASASLVWFGLLAFAAANQTTPYVLVSTLVFQAAAFICHQQPDRSFTWDGLRWPVCARCLGLYASAPAGAVLALAARRAATAGSRENFLLLCIAALPTFVTLLLERALGWPVTNMVRFGAALPLGAAIAWLLIRTLVDSGTRVSQYTLSDARRGESR